MELAGRRPREIMLGYMNRNGKGRLGKNGEQEGVSR